MLCALSQGGRHSAAPRQIPARDNLKMEDLNNAEFLLEGMAHKQPNG